MADPAPQSQERCESKQPYERKIPPISIHELRCTVDDAGRRFFHHPSGRAVCGRRKKAKSRAIEDEACLAPPTRYGPCKVHGAKAGAPMTANGRYSRVLGRWKPAFERALKDEALLDTRRDLALMDSAIEQLLDRVGAADCPTWRAELSGIYRDLDTAVKGGRQRQVGPLLKQLGEKIDEGAKVDAAVNDLLRHVDRRADRAHKINELEARREEKLTAREVAVLFARIVEVLREKLEPRQFALVVPHLQRLTQEVRLPVAGSAEERDRQEAAGETLQELAGDAEEIASGEYESDADDAGADDADDAGDLD